MLQQVEGAVATQTAWKLEPAYRYEDDADLQSDQNEQGAVPVHAQQSANVLNDGAAADNVSSVSLNASLPFLDKQ